jgi:hypothetical protein
MKRHLVITTVLLLACLAFADPAVRSYPAPKIPSLDKYNALGHYPLQQGKAEPTTWADFGLKGKVKKFYVETSEVVARVPVRSYDHAIVRFDSLGHKYTTINYPPPKGQGYKYVFNGNNQLERVLRYFYQDGFKQGIPDNDNLFADQGTETAYQYDADGYIAKISYFNAEGQLNRENTYTYATDGYTVAITYIPETTTKRNQVWQYDSQGRLTGITERNMKGKYLPVGKFTYDAKNNSSTAMQDYVSGYATQKTVESWDANGRLKERSVMDPQNNLMRKYTYTYNDAGLLIKETYSSPNDKFTTNYNYKFDQTGNITEVTIGADKVADPLRISISYEYY